MSTSSRQEAMEGEPVRRHVSDAVLNYNKPVYGLFLAIRIDTNTAETFRHGIWYAKGDVKQRLDIVPLSLSYYIALPISSLSSSCMICLSFCILPVPQVCQRAVCWNMEILLLSVTGSRGIMA